ncbi:MAG: hypothetical protein NTY45_08070 [Elusimicrobia bacterium]|nr:hypothetical protein [Elusimicrobiota bacterium]
MKTLTTDELNAAMLTINGSPLIASAKLLETFNREHSVVNRFIERFAINVDLPKNERGFLRLSVFVIWALLHYCNVEIHRPYMDVLMEVEAWNIETIDRILETDPYYFGDKLITGHPQPALVSFVIMHVLNSPPDLVSNHKTAFIAVLKCVAECYCGLKSEDLGMQQSGTC